MNLEEKIINGIIHMDRLERRHGMAATVTGILLILVVSVTTLFAIIGISLAWFSFVNWAFQYFFGFSL